MDGLDLLRWILGLSVLAFTLWFACRYCVADTDAEVAASDARVDALDATYGGAS